MNDVAEKKHAILSPSGHSRWSVCPGSVELERPFPNRGSKFARFGTAAHEIAERALTTGNDAEWWLDEELVVEGESIKVDMAMCDIVNTFVSYVRTFLDVEAGDVILAEQGVPLDHMTGEQGAEGTSDVIGFRKRPDGRYTIVVVDLKTGAGVPVFAKDDSGKINGQMGMYAGGALRKFDDFYDIADAQLVIIQPPLHIVDDVTISVEQLRAFMDEVSIAAGRTQIGSAELVPGEKQCKFCRAKSTCPALRDNVLAIVTATNGASASTAASFAAIDTNPGALPKLLAAEIAVADDGELLAAQMRATALVETWLKGVRAEVERRLFEGQKVPGYKVVQGKKGNRAWADPDEALALMKKMTGIKIDDVAPRAIVTPPAAEKLFKGKDKQWAKIAPLIAPQKEGGPSVAPESDPRPEYQVVSTAESFAAVTAVEEPLTAPADKVSSTLSDLLS